MDRRKFLRSASMAGSAALGINRFFAYADRADAAVASRGNGGYGSLGIVASSNTGEKLVALPQGFGYTVLGRTGDRMSDGRPTPPRHDGMATFEVNGQLRLVRNHEINNLLGKEGMSLGDANVSYDPLAAGGTTTLIIDPKTRMIVRDFISLSGTLHNCAGGPTPWGSWISCEETVLGRQAMKDARDRDVGSFSQPHGYCFEVPAAADAPSIPVALKAMGRFVHEAIAVDTSTGTVYETEDAGQAGFYRFIPNTRGRLAEGGRLQMLAIDKQPGYQAATGQKVGIVLPAVWVDISDPDPSDAQTNPSSVFKQGQAKGGATFIRLEGCWHSKGRIFFTSTSGGDLRLGQVWEYRPKGRDKGDLKLLYESTAQASLESPDNICVSPRGGLVMCEDGKTENFLRGLTSDGRIFDFARNAVAGHEATEFAGAVFSPDGGTLFVNIQTPGLTLAIWGPWKDGAL